MASILRTRATLALRSTPTITPSLFRPIVATSQIRYQTATATAGSAGQSSHAVSAPMLADIEKRWEGMPPQEQAELWMALRDRMKGSWAELTMAEKKACTYQPYSSSITIWPPIKVITGY